VIIVLYGLSSNGKTTLIDALHGLPGPDAQHAPTDVLLARRGEHHPTQLATLHGPRLVTAAETGAGRRLAESLVKQLIGGDPVTARRMREDFWEFRPEFKLWLATNHKPQPAAPITLWRRIRLIPFDVTFHAPGDREDTTARFGVASDGIGLKADGADSADPFPGSTHEQNSQRSRHGSPRTARRCSSIPLRALARCGRGRRGPSARMRRKRSMMRSRSKTAVMTGVWSQGV
jgi:hypothetical protein